MLEASTMFVAASKNGLRRYPRHAIKEWIVITVGGRDFTCLAEDVGLGGVRLREVVLAAGEEVTVYLPSSDGDLAYVIDGSVAWSKGTRAGIRFDRTPENFAALFELLEAIVSA